MAMNKLHATLKRLLSLVAVAALALIPTPTLAFWEYGHGVVAAIAYRNITPETRIAIDRLLAKSAQLETPDCPVTTIELAAAWADCIRPLKERYGHSFSWHYQNVDICKPYSLESACGDGNCVSAQIENQAKLLADRKLPDAKRLEALAFLIHFVGDLHNPLHAGDRSDRGGNDLKADYGLAGGRLSLHAIWDGPLAERALSTPPGLVRVYSQRERATLAAGSVADWSREGWETARRYVYPAALDGDACGPRPESRAKISDEEIDGLIAPMRDGVVRAGLRLARMLDQVLG